MENFTLEEINEFLETDEYQQLDELSKKTLGSYIKKASTDAVNNASEGGYKLGGNKHNVYDTSKDEEDEEGQDNDRKATKRTQGIKKAVDKIVKEEEQLDEISKKTLGSYIKKAAQDVDDNAYTAGSVHVDTSARGNKTYDDTTARAEKRKAGIGKAVNKLVKESLDMQELFHQIDSGNLVDAKATVTEIISDKVANTLEIIKQSLSGSLVNESKCTDENGDEEVAEANAKLPKPKKAKPEVDGEGNVIEKWKPVKVDLDESIVASKNDKANKAIDDIYAKAKANTKTVNVKDLFKKKSKE